MKISVVIPSYNRAGFLERTIGSVVNQSYKAFEIIIVDDCSQDDTAQVVLDLQGKWKNYTDIKYVKHSVNKGESGSRNTGIREASGEWVAFLDSDDEWHKDKLERQVRFLEQNSSFDGVVCEYFQVDEGQNSLICFSEDVLDAKKVFTHGSSYGIGTNLLLKREKLTICFDENLKLFADMDWLYRILLHYKIGVLHEPLSYYYKSPMRSGDYIKEHAFIFLRKHEKTIQALSFKEKRRLFGTIHWYIALAYDAHGNFGLALHHFLRGLKFVPFRRVGNHIYILKLFLRWIVKRR